MKEQDILIYHGAMMRENIFLDENIVVQKDNFDDSISMEL
jgi:hypothetical protein